MIKEYDDGSIALSFSTKDIQELSIKYFGDELSDRELDEFISICNPRDWARVDDGGYEGALGQLLSAVVLIIMLVRNDRRAT